MIRETPPNRLAVELTDPDRRYRYGPDDRDPQSRPGALNISFISPGGDGPTGYVLARQPGYDWPDTERLNRVRVYGPGNETQWEGLVTQPSRSWGEAQIGIEADGYKQTLTWNPTLRIPYVDRDLNNWQGMTRERRINMYTAGFDSLADGVVEDDLATGLPAMNLRADGALTDPNTEAWYDAGPGSRIGSIYHDHVGAGLSASWVGRLFVADDDVATNSETGSDLVAGASPSGSGTFTPATRTDDRWGGLQLQLSGSVATTVDRYLTFRRLAVFANHGLTKYGTAPNEGYLGSDILDHALTQLAPPITWTTGSNGSIEATSFVLEHLVFGRERGVNAQEVIEGVDRFEGRAWGVHGTKLFWRPRGSGRKWRLRRSQVGFSEEGNAADSAFNGVVVYYADPAGTQKSVGPSDAPTDDTDTDLEDTSEMNPVNERGLGRKWLILEVSGMTTLAGATQLGIIALRELTRPTRGTARVVGVIEDARGNLAWPWAMRDDDVVQFADEIGGPERIVTSVRYDHSSGEAQVELDGPEKRMDVVLARLEIAVAGLGLG